MGKKQDRTCARGAGDRGKKEGSGAVRSCAGIERAGAELKGQKSERASIGLPMEARRRQQPTFPQCSIIGRPGLTAVFGMGTGVSPAVWSPTIPKSGPFGPGEESGLSAPAPAVGRRAGRMRDPDGAIEKRGEGKRTKIEGEEEGRCVEERKFGAPDRAPRLGSRGREVGAAKLSTVRTARLKVLPLLQLRPINLVVFQGSHAQKCTQVSS